MRLPTQYSQRTPLRFNITPLIDVVFLLIIFFLVASHFVRSEQAEPVELPLAGTGEIDIENSPYRLTVTISRDGSYFIGGEPQAEAAVFVRVEEMQQTAVAAQVEPEIRIRPDRLGQHGPFRRLYEHCAKHNIRRIQFAVSSEAGH
jgi:biopolymer transport protein ExbD